MNLITPLGAIGSSSCLTSSKRLKRPRAPIKKATAGKNASSELYATSCESPMQSSRMKAAKLRLSAAIHSPRLSRSGDAGVRPTRARCSVAVDKTERPDLGFCLAFASAAKDQPRGRADPTCQQESHPERADRGDRQVGAQLRAHIGRLAQALAERLCCTGELFALVLDLATHFGDAAGVVPVIGHCSSAPR